MAYDTAEYEKQAAGIRRKIRKEGKHLSGGEYLYGFSKDSKLNPVITFVLYSGAEEWDGPVSLHEMIDFTDIPQCLKEMTKENWIKGGKVDMCTALTKLIADGRDEGRREGISQGRREGISQGIEESTRRIVFNMIKRNMPEEDICALAECSREFVHKLRESSGINE